MREEVDRKVFDHAVDHKKEEHPESEDGSVTRDRIIESAQRGVLQFIALDPCVADTERKTYHKKYQQPQQDITNQMLPALDSWHNYQGEHDVAHIQESVANGHRYGVIHQQVIFDTCFLELISISSPFIVSAMGDGVRDQQK